MHPVLEMFTILDVMFEGIHLARIQFRTKQLICLFLMLTSMMLGFSFLPRARAEIAISSINPSSGNVGTQVLVTANLTTTNGTYEITFDGAILKVGNATGNDVNDSFVVPETTYYQHNVGIVDVKTGENATVVFDVLTAYSMNVTVPTPPAQLQEGDSVPIFVNVTGGNSSSTFDAAVSVQTPANVNCTGTVSISTSSLGSGNATLTYPEDFSDANTSYVGDYAVSLNLASAVETFSVGLTNSTVYHRTQAVSIRAAYAPAENVTLTVSGNGIQNSTVNVTADSLGVINYSNWTVPATAPIGTYSVSIVSVSGQTVKVPPDIQNFTVPGFAFNVTAKNLAGEAVPNVDVRAFENGASVGNQTTDSNGLVVLTLEIGNYTLQGYSEGVEVGESEFLVNGTEAVDFVLNLTDLSIRVVAIVNGAEIGIPEVGVYLLPENLTLATDITGNVVVPSLLPDATYTLNASRYNTSFNVTTLTSLLVGGNLVPFFNVTIGCPSFALQINVFKADGQPFGNATVQVKELLGGIQYDGNTDSNGIVVFKNATLGEYDVEIHDSTGKELNSTTVDLFQDQNVTVNCDLFGLNISVTVTDYFGQPFANTNITLQGNGSETVSQRTQANGVVTFDNLVGDSFSISVYLSDQGPPTVVESLHVDGSTTVPIKINRYVLLVGLPVETSQLAIAVIIVLSVLLVLSLEVYRRRRNKSQKTDS
jgi:membrane protein implicated in regulation of membrane protease activity